MNDKLVLFVLLITLLINGYSFFGGNFGNKFGSSEHSSPRASQDAMQTNKQLMLSIEALQKDIQRLSNNNKTLSMEQQDIVKTISKLENSIALLAMHRSKEANDQNLTPQQVGYADGNTFDSNGREASHQYMSYGAVAESFENQVPDPELAPQIEAQFDRAISDALESMPGSLLVNLECRTTACVVDLSLENEENLRDLLDKIDTATDWQGVVSRQTQLGLSGELFVRSYYQMN